MDRDIVRSMTNGIAERRDGLLEPALTLEYHPELVVSMRLVGGQGDRMTEGLHRLRIPTALLERGADPFIDLGVRRSKPARVAEGCQGLRELSLALQGQPEPDV